MHERMNRQNSWGLIPRTNSDRKTVPRNGSMCVAASLLSSLVVAAECSLVAAALNDDVEHFVCGVIITTATTAGSGSAMKDGGKNAASAGGNKDVTFVSAIRAAGAAKRFTCVRMRTRGSCIGCSGDPAT